jgi:PRTRC genetic system protein E
LFVELMPLLKQRTLLITVARIDEKLKVNVIPAKAKEGEDEALTTPLSYTGSPEELDREFGQHLASYVDSHLARLRQNAIRRECLLNQQYSRKMKLRAPCRADQANRT